MIVVVCGVSGTGKSTIGALLANALDLDFYDGDDFHPRANVEKMQNGAALDDTDRKPWLDTLASNLAVWANQGGAVLACSALKESYRKRLASQCSYGLNWVFLKGSKALLMKRLYAREDHFFDPELLHSQLETLEPPNYGLLIDIESSPHDIVADIVTRLYRASSSKTVEIGNRNDP